MGTRTTVQPVRVTRSSPGPQDGAEPSSAGAKDRGARVLKAPEPSCPSGSTISSRPRKKNHGPGHARQHSRASRIDPISVFVSHTTETETGDGRSIPHKLCRMEPPSDHFRREHTRAYLSLLVVNAPNATDQCGHPAPRQKQLAVIVRRSGAFYTKKHEVAPKPSYRDSSLAQRVQRPPSLFLSRVPARRSHRSVPSP